ncbi:MAG: cytochrome c [Deltaproteobacteria bacterium]|nr:cytochrome c [Deltaproteobacteria bacterium]
MMNPSTRIHWTIAIALAALVSGMAPAAFAGDAAAGKTVYTTNCVACHGETGKGDGPVGIAIQPPPRDFSVGEFVFDTDEDGEKGSDADLTSVIKDGAMKYGGSPLMAPWSTLSDDDIANLVAHIRSLKQ